MDKLVKVCKEYKQKFEYLSSITQIEETDIMEKAYYYAKRLGYSTEDILGAMQYLLGKGKSWQEVCNDLDNNIFPNTTIDSLPSNPQPSYDEKSFTQALKEYFSNLPTNEEAKNNLNALIKASLGEIEIKLGDKVIRKDGLVGKVENFYGTVPVVLFEDNSSVWITDSNTDAFYLIGKTVLGNKIDEEELQRQLDEQWDKCKVEQAKYDQLRKQLWYLKNRMVEDWYEKKQQADKEKAERKAEKEKKED